jgi:hypothetical protein
VPAPPCGASGPLQGVVLDWILAGAARGLPALSQLTLVHAGAVQHLGLLHSWPVFGRGLLQHPCGQRRGWTEVTSVGSKSMAHVPLQHLVRDGPSLLLLGLYRLLWDTEEA